MSRDLKERQLEELEAADLHVRMQVPRADSFNGHAPLWHGWALTDAFFAGVDWALEQKK